MSERIMKLARTFAQEWLRPQDPDHAAEALVDTLSTAMLAFYACAKDVRVAELEKERDAARRAAERRFKQSRDSLSWLYAERDRLLAEKHLGYVVCMKCSKQIPTQRVTVTEASLAGTAPARSAAPAHAPTCERVTHPNSLHPCNCFAAPEVKP